MRTTTTTTTVGRVLADGSVAARALVTGTPALVPLAVAADAAGNVALVARRASSTDVMAFVAAPGAATATAVPGLFLPTDAGVGDVALTSPSPGRFTAVFVQGPRPRR